MVGTTLLLVAWGTFAFGAAYPWAYQPLAIGSALVGAAALVTGGRPFWSPNRWLLIALLGIFVVGIVQVIPLPLAVLQRISPGTVAFLANYDFRYSLTADPTAAEMTTVALRHAISIAPARTLLFLQLFAASALLFVGLLRTLSRTAATRLARGIVFIGFMLAMVAILQKAILGDDAFGGMRIYGFWEPEFKLSTPFGPYVNKNHFAGWMLMAIPVSLGLAMGQLERESTRFRYGMRSFIVWLSEPGGGRMLLYLIAALVMTLSLLMTGSRSGLGCFAVVTIAAALITQRRRSRRAVLGFAVGVMVFVALALVWAGRDAALERFTSDRGSVQLRLDVWSVSARILRQFPVLGTGLNAFGTATILYQPQQNDQHFNEAHNDYVQLAVEGGLVTLALLLVAIAGLARGIRARFVANDDGAEARWVRLGATTGIVAVAVQSLVEFSLQMPGNAVLFVVLLAMALYVPAPLQPQP
ncbi:MAG TPA: O-antigen ligase family protein [Vicinamibacterales bacterium]|nr:O-antigen ligase family protein [Vicinamibacterales bacterium]